MFEKEAIRSFDELDDRGVGDDWSIEESYINGFSIGAEFGYNKSKEELNQNGLALQSDMDKTIEQNIALKKELNERSYVTLEEKLTKAKELIKDYMIIVKGAHTTVCGVPEENRTIYVLKLNEEAEQFLKENT